ncbi:nuclear transport factor 2 family protein [Puia dinghuensis]|uniref:Ketosteroid isomerase n=1 Tax=Puia dinghuensis TaxID=1792502 RepID=A0A8J2UBE0_9BACT|nr:nuclear transport factor 2 family protein [Puia dinghuensis]GGA93879.1 ketosteroid isomerase [Puia dinghuensis]
MENATKKTVESFLNALLNGDMETVAGLIHPDVKWTQPGNNRFSGIRNSAAEVFEMSAGWQAVSEGTFRLTGFSPIGVNGDEVACILHFKATSPGDGLDIDNIDVYSVRDNKIASAKIFSLDQQAEDSFWGN